MLETSVDEVATALVNAKNLNAALKSFLKKEGNSAPHVATFAKEFRVVAAKGKPEPVRFFVEQNYPRRAVYFLGLARYAYPELVESTVGQIIDRHAERFNATYEKGENGITITDTKTFSSIVKDVLKLIDESISSAQTPSSNFMRNAIMASVFEPDVLEEVVKILK